MSQNPRSDSKNKVQHDPVDELKRRSRRRLVGSIALFLTAVIVVPALVDNQGEQKETEIELVMPPRPSADPKVEFAQTQHDKDAVIAPDSESTGTVMEPIKPPAKPEPKNESAASAAKEQAKEAALEPKPKEFPKQESKPTLSEDPIAKFAQTDVFWVQVSAVKDSARAEQLKTTLTDKGFASKVESVTTDQGKVFRVRVGPLAGQAAANDTKNTLQQQGYVGRVVR